MTKKLTTKKKTAESVCLTGLQEAELIEFVNWAEGDMGLRSALQQFVVKMQDGVWRQKTYNAHNPEDGIISRLDRIKRHRTIHRALRSIGQHARVLTNAYLIAPKPAYVSAVFGNWHSGIALATTKDVAGLVIACRDVRVEGDAKHPDAKKMLERVRGNAIELYNRAVAAYLPALELARQPLAKDSKHTLPKLETQPHECREGTPAIKLHKPDGRSYWFKLHKCPCGNGD